VEDSGSGDGNRFADRVRVANQFADRVLCVMKEK